MKNLNRREKFLVGAVCALMLVGGCLFPVAAAGEAEAPTPALPDEVTEIVFAARPFGSDQHY